MNIQDLPQSIWDWPNIVDWPKLNVEFVRLIQAHQDSPKLLFQYLAAIEVRSMMEAVQKDDDAAGGVVLDAVAICAKNDLVMPDWLVIAFLRRYRRVRHFKARTWDEAFGQPHRKGVNLAAQRKERAKSIQVYELVTRLTEGDNPLSVQEAIQEAGDSLGLGRTLAEGYYYDWKRDIDNLAGRTTATKKVNPHKSKK